MKKLTTLLIICCIALMLTFGLTACGDKTCEHIYDNACDAICNECEETRTITHDWNAADCDTPKTCSICGATEGEALGHTAEADDGNCTTEIKCATCGTVLTSGKTQHVAHADDGDCTTPVTCTECSTVITAAKSHDFSGAWEKDASGHWHICANEGCTKTDTKADHISDGAATEEKAEKCTVCEYVITPELDHVHNHNIPKYDTENHWIECACGDKSAVTAHTANNDDGDCTTAVTCSGCAHIMTAAKAHTPNADDGDCTTDITCKDCSKVTTAGNKEHTPNADDGDCTTAITCQYCDVVTTEARNKHTGGTPTCTHGKLCEVCGVEYDTTKNPDNHVFIDGVCACGELQTIDATEMTAEQLNAAVAELLASGVTDITIKMSADADMDMFTALRTALAESTAPDGSINLTISGAKTVPDEGFIDMLDYFENDDKNIAGDKLKSLTLTDVETIGDFAFSACTYLESVNLPQVVTIGECAFNEWKKGTKLTTLDLPNATTIGDWAFAYSSLLTSVNLPKVVTIGTVAFADCDLRTLDLPEATTIGGEAFMNNDNLVSCSAPKATTIDYYPWGSNGTSKLERLELTAVGNFTLSNNLFAYTSTEQIDLVLNKDKESQVTQNEDGTATWNIKDGYGNFYTFKSITFACSDGTTNHDYQYTDNGDGTHDAVCSKCDYVKVDNGEHIYAYTDNGDGTHSKMCACGNNISSEAHTAVNHICTDCGAMKIVVSFDAGDYEWKTGDELYFCRVSRDNQWEEYCFTATVAEDGTVTWIPDKPLYWDGTGEHGLIVSYPANMGLGWDDFAIPGDQSTPELLRDADHMNARWVGTPTTNVIEFELKHRMAKITVNYTIASQFDPDAPVIAEIYSNAMYCIFKDADGLPIITSVGRYDAWIIPYHNDNQFTAYVAPGEYNTDGMFKFYIGDAEVQIKIANPGAVTLEEGGEYTFDVKVGQDVLTIVEVSMGDIDSPFGDGWHNEIELRAIGTQAEGKTAWEVGDQIIVTFISPSFGTQYGTLTYDGTVWSTDVSFSYLEDETPTVSAMYAPCYDVVDGNIQLKYGMQLGMTEYILAACSVTDGILNISFDGAIRNYSRLRIVGLANQTLTVITTGFTPAGATEEATKSYTLTTDEDGNADIYGTFAEGATILVQLDETELAQYSFYESTANGMSYALDALSAQE